MLLRLRVRVLKLRELRTLVIRQVCYGSELIPKLVYLRCRVVVQLFQFPDSLRDNGYLISDVTTVVQVDDILEKVFYLADASVITVLDVRHGIFYFCNSVVC